MAPSRPVPIHFGTLINPLDARGGCEDALDEALRQGKAGRVSVEKLRMGQQAVIEIAAWQGAVRRLHSAAHAIGLRTEPP